jgi:hypothetical protein
MIMVQSIYIINDDGETLAKVDLGSFEADEALFGGFLSAIQTFSEKMTGDAVQELFLGNYRMMIQRIEGHFLVVVLDKSAKDPLIHIRRIADVFKENIAVGVTDDLLEKLKVMALTSVKGTDRADDWASKMF